MKTINLGSVLEHMVVLIGQLPLLAWVSAALALVGVGVLGWRNPRFALSHVRDSGGSEQLGVNIVGFSRSKRRLSADMSMIVVEVASRLTSGEVVETAWAKTLGRVDPRLQGGLQGSDESDAPDELDVAWDLKNDALDEGVPRALVALENKVLEGKGRIFSRDPLDVMARSPGFAATVPALRAACRVSHKVGAPLAQVLDTCATAITQAAEDRGERDIALAAPRATARLLGGLPLLALLLGHAVGADPLGILLSGSIGTLVICVGIGLMVAGNIWTRALVKQAMEPPGRTPIDEGVLLVLTSSILDCGASIPNTIEALAWALDVQELKGVGTLLILGASWEEAWARAGPGYARLSRALEPAWVDGSAPSALLLRAANQLRRTRAQENKKAAQKLSVQLVMPLGLCLLPAFMAIGLAPVIISTAQGMLG
ncbi:MAG: type II secretion system F family protein [Actinomycetaceae bacterium]|nr:type II secretion system F family protein [Actinomycetaceae bacterium]